MTSTEDNGDTLDNRHREDELPSPSGPDSDREEMLALVYSLSSNRADVVNAAARALRDISPDSIAALMQMVQTEGMRGKWRRRRFLTISIGSTGLILTEMIRLASFDSMEFLFLWMIGIPILSLFVAQSITTHEALN